MLNEITKTINKSVQNVKSVGESRAILFNKLNIFNIEDLITYFPRQYEDRTSLKKISELEDNETCTFEGVIISAVTENRLRKGLTIYKVTVKDETGVIISTWFNQSFLKNVFKLGESYLFYGKVIKKYRTLEIQSPIFEKLVENKELKNTCRIIPIYNSTAKLSQNIIRSVIGNALKLVEGKLEEFLPDWLRNKYNLSELNYCIQNIHFPISDEDFKNARYRLVFEEFLILQLGLLSIKSSLQVGKKGIIFRKIAEIDDFISGLPFKLTDAQLKVFKEIESDMESQKIMNRLVQGDVGSGKTIVAALALFKAVKCGYQGTLMVPTEILAEQHYKSITQLMEPYGISVGLLTGSLTQKRKKELIEKIDIGKIDIVIGTHALIEDSVTFYKLGLVITDEQHRFGVRQRALLAQKGDNPDIIIMTATPIPRTLALILYGDLDISIIDQLPPGRKPIKTYSVNNGMRERINNFIHDKVKEGRQVFIVCPLVEESESIEAKSAVELAERIAHEEFKALKVGLIHGKLRPSEKDEEMRNFVAGNTDILVSTTVIEVGVNVPNATIMIIENAERFGLAQLHQLRGRVGRGEHQSHCILFNESKTQVSRERMKVMEKTNDGFIISEKDLELRGPGEFFGVRQHGLPEFKIANIYEDMEILKIAQKATAELFSIDPLFSSVDNIKLKSKIKDNFEKAISHISFT